MLRIVLKFNDAVLKEFDINTEEISIGRKAGNDIQVDSLAVSGHHARIELRGGKYHIEDLNSTNGMYINEKRYTKAVLKNKDEVTIGKHTLVIFTDPKDIPVARTDPQRLEMDETMVLDTKRHKRMLGKTADADDLKGLPRGVALITVEEGSTDKSQYKLTAKLTVIGKDPNAGIKLEGFLMPKIAGFISRSKEGYFFIPPERKNKLKINGSTVKANTGLKDEDELKIGGVRMRFRLK